MRRIAVFARRPRAGQVKTRLSPALPADLACVLFRAMLEDALAAALSAEADQRSLYWAEDPEDTGSGGIPASSGVRRAERFEARRQVGQDLGERMERAFADLLRAPADRGVLIGTDCPLLDGATIGNAFEALARHDLVLGPTSDGGYYLVGLRRRAPDLFGDIAWSSGSEREQTLERARALGLSTFLLPGLDDIDTAGDLVSWVRARLLDPRPAAPHTADALRSMGLLPPNGRDPGRSS